MQENESATDSGGAQLPKPTVMHIEYELTENDIYELQVQNIHARRVRLQEWDRNPWFFVVVVGIAAVVGWPIWCWLGLGDPNLSIMEPYVFARYALCILIAAVIAFVLINRLPRRRPKFRTLNAWQARRLTPRAVKASVMGAVTLEVTGEMLIRSNTEATQQFPWNSIRRILRTPPLISLYVPEQKRFVIIPTRAFSDADGETEFLRRVEQLTGLTTFDVPT